MAMQYEAESEQMVSVAKGRANPTYGYYRQPNGWIKAAVITPIEELKYREEGWEPLKQYGRFDMGNSYAANHPLEALFIYGGASELPVEQVVQMGLYMDPPLIPSCHQPIYQYHPAHQRSCWNRAKQVEFPQLQGVSGLGPFACTICAKKLPTTAARDQHESVAHKEEKGDIRTGEVLAEALVKGLRAAPSQAVAPVVVSEPPGAIDLPGMLGKLQLSRKQKEALRKLGIQIGEGPEPEQLHPAKAIQRKKNPMPR